MKVIQKVIRSHQKKKDLSQNHLIQQNGEQDRHAKGPAQTSPTFRYIYSSIPFSHPIFLHSCNSRSKRYHFWPYHLKTCAEVWFLEFSEGVLTGFQVLVYT